jgi:hypothetical protein
MPELKVNKGAAKISARIKSSTKATPLCREMIRAAALRNRAVGEAASLSSFERTIISSDIFLPGLHFIADIAVTIHPTSVDNYTIDPSFHQVNESERMTRGAAHKDNSMRGKYQAIKLFVSFAVVCGSREITKNLRRIVDASQ